MSTTETAREPQRSRRIALGIAATVCLVVGGLVSAPLAAEADSGSGAPPAAPPDAQSASSAASAQQIAEAYDHGVVVDPDTTPLSQTVAEPDGTMQLTESALPVRVQEGSSWVPVDTTLSQGGDGMWTPNATVAPVEFSGGGSDVLDEVQTPGGGWITETWPYGDLPTPTVSGSTATYSQVLPGVDIILTATSTGLSDVLEIESATAAANPDLKALLLPVSGATVTSTASETATATTPSGSTVVAASPVWWDAADGSTAQGPQGDTAEMPVQSSVSSSGLTVAVASTVQAASPVYPVFIDPDWSSGGSPFWYTDAAYPNQSYLNGEESDGWQGVGIGGGYQSDMFWQFSLSGVQGKFIKEAVLNTEQLWANSCSPTAIDVHLYGPKTPGFTWNQEQSYSGQWGGILQSQNPNAGCSSSVPEATVGWTVTSGVASKVADGDTSAQFAFTYHDPSSQLSRRHYSQSATLVITYYTQPSTPSSLSISSPPRTCGTASAPAVLNDANDPVVFDATLDDPDSGVPLNASFDVDSTSSLGTNVWSTNVANITPNSVAQATMQAGELDAGDYAWRVIAGDGQIDSPYSAWCYFDVDETVPAAPQVVTLTGSAPYTVGMPVGISIAAPGDASDIAEYEVWVTPGTGSSTVPVQGKVLQAESMPECGSAQGSVQMVCPAADGTITATVAAVDSTNTVWAASVDEAGNVSAPVGATLTAGDAPLVGAHGWHTATDTSLPTTIPDDDQTAGSGIADVQNLAVGAGVDTSKTDIGPSGTSEAVISLSGLIRVTRLFNGTDYGVGYDSNIPSGYSVQSMDEGELLPLSSGGSSTVWSGTTTEIYLCTLSNGQTMLGTSTSDCGSGSTAKAIGYSFDAEPTSTAAPGTTSIHLYRCTNGTDHVTSASTTCETWDKTPDESLGWFLTTGLVETSGQAIDTTKSFTVSAWVKPGIPSGATNLNYHAIMSETGATNSGFYLTTDTSGVPKFCLREQIAVTIVCAQGAAPLSDSQWTLVTGIYDTANQQIRLLVGNTITGVTVSRAPVPGDTSPTGSIVIGSAETDGLMVNEWNGEIVDPVAIPEVIDTNQMSNLLDHEASVNQG